MRTLLLGLLFVLPAAAKEKELLKNGAIGGGAGWRHTPGAPTVDWKIDRKEGAAKRGCLFIANSNAGDTAPHNWFTRFDVPKGAPYRLKLAVKIKTADMAPGAKANVMVQVYPKEGQAIGYAWCKEIKEDTDWRETHAVFAIPEEAAYVRILSYLVGKGKAWFDDYSVQKTTDDLTGPPATGARGVDDKYWKLVRSAAEEIEWVLDLDAALARARKERKPLLVYARCTDDQDGLESMQTTLRAEKVRNLDDGLSKDVLFRAGPLSDPDVADLINRRFVPALASYHFGTLGTGRGTGLDWWHTPGAPTVTFRIDEAEGKGSLHIANTAVGTTAHNWAQSVNVERAGRHRLSARIKAKGFGDKSEACVMLQTFDDKAANGGGRVRAVKKNTNWKKLDTTFDVPEGTKSLTVRAYLVGKGEVWFDDIKVVRAKEKKNLLKNGEIDPTKGGDPLKRFGFKASETVTPALLVATADGAGVRRLHRIGTLSTDLVDHWLRGVLAEAGARSRASSPQVAYKDGELEKVLKGKDALLRAKALVRLGRLDEAGHEAVRWRVHLRRGEWRRAAAALSGDGEEARFWRAWCFHRLGQHAKAELAWQELAGPTRYGRKAAACLLPAGPRLWLSASERAWPRTRVLPEQTEGFQDFDAAQSLEVLLELQVKDGSFGSHRGAPGYGYWDGAMTALAAEALWRWLDHAPALKGRMAAAHDRAVEYLAQWAGRNNAGNDAFNNPYVLMHLVRVGKEEAGAKVIARIARSQNPDGNWTVYQRERPASFNTALAVMALAHAQKAGWEIPEDVLQRGAEALAGMRQANDLFPYSTMKGHEWMTTEHGSIARDSLCEHALLLVDRGDKDKLTRALERWAKFAHELRAPTKNYYDYFNTRGHGGYYFFFAHRNAQEAARFADEKVQERTHALVRTLVLQSREGDGAFMDHYMNGRGYGTAQALILLAPRKN